MEHNDKIKKAFWITEDMDREIDAHLKQDNCSLFRYRNKSPYLDVRIIPIDAIKQRK